MATENGHRHDESRKNRIRGRGHSPPPYPVSFDLRKWNHVKQPTPFQADFTRPYPSGGGGVSSLPRVDVPLAPSGVGVGVGVDVGTESPLAPEMPDPRLGSIPNWTAWLISSHSGQHCGEVEGASFSSRRRAVSGIAPAYNFLVHRYAARMVVASADRLEQQVGRPRFSAGCRPNTPLDGLAHDAGGGHMVTRTKGPTWRRTR